jgi:uncharacterized protein (DUF2267 family)
MTHDEFLRRVREAGGGSAKEAERAAAAVVIALGELLPDAERRRHFASQLPGPLKSRLLDEAPRSLAMNREAFVRHVGASLGVHAAEAERMLHAVYGVLREALSPGEMADFEACIPKEVAALLARG